jgi:hypothetical protein
VNTERVMREPGWRSYRWGVSLVLAAGILHAVVHLIMSSTALRSGPGLAASGAMQNATFTIAGVTRNMLDGYLGFSWMVAAFGVMVATVSLSAAQSFRRSRLPLSRGFLLANLLAAVTALVVSLAYFPVVPMALFGAASLSFALAISQAGRAQRVPGAAPLEC